jgi:hypothetical protein
VHTNLLSLAKQKIIHADKVFLIHTKSYFLHVIQFPISLY